MANKKLTDLTELTTPADDDFLYIVDVSDTTESPQGTSKKIRKDKVDLGASKENIANKSDIYTTDTEKYYSATYVNGVLPTSYSKIVYVNATSPTTATIFDLENPPVTNDNLLKNDTANLYIGTDASTWVYLTGTGYVTKTISSATSNFNTFGTTVDAGNSKTSHITRSGPVTLIGSLNLAVAKISTTPNTSAGSYDILTRNSSTTALEKVSSISFGNWTYSGGLIYPKSLTDKVAIGMNSEGLGIPFSVKAFSGSNDIAWFYSNAGTMVAKITSSGITASILNSDSYVLATQLNLSGYNGGIFGPSAVSQIKLLSGETWDVKGKLKYNVDYSSSYDARTLVDKAYTDAKITQTITNGVTDKSPSEDAVYDATFDAVKTIITDTPTSTNTGGVSEVLMHTYTIAGGKLPASCMPNLKVRLSKLGTVGTVTIRIKVNTVNDFSTATNIGFFTSATNFRGGVFVRNFTLQGSELTHTNAANSIINDEAATGNVNGVITYVPANTYYWFISLQNSDSTDTTRVHSIKLVN